MKRILLIFILIIAVITAAGCSNKGPALPKAEDFTLNNGYGKTYSLNDFKGKMVILNFWATWCPPCKKEIPDFIKLYEKYKDNGLVILGVSVDQGGWMITKEFAESAGINYPIVMANRDITYKYGGVRSIPTTFVINQKGQIAASFTGYRPRNIWEEQIRTILKIK